MKLSVVVPTWNEAFNLEATLRALPRNAEVLIVDGGSADGTVEIARRAGARVLTCPKGRARQMHAGALEARGDTLLFLHADAVLEPGADEAMEEAFSDPSVIGGFFQLRIRSERLVLRVIALGSNLRARLLRLPYGDQGLFLRRSVYEQAGGFPDLPFLEDVALIRMVRRKGRLRQLPVAVSTGDRHWRELGILRTTLLDWTMVGLYCAGVSPSTLAPQYFRRRAVQLD
ncbi:MAG TPA: TIGR04283 family arsenosugar biosynthesis glycosyltransferase [Vicinamibacteria bacterium]